MLNRFDDRMYFATDSGMVVCLREIGATQPDLLRDPKALPFGYIPPEGIKKTPPPVPEGDTPAAPGAEPKDAAPAKPKGKTAKDAAAKPAEEPKDSEPPK